MKNWALSILLFFASIPPVYASKILAECENPSGHAYYLESGLVAPGKGGWQEDAITNGSILLIKESEGGYDLIYKSINNETTSSKADGANIILIRNDINEALFLVIYPRNTAEFFHFFQEEGKGLHFAMYQNKPTPIPKNSLMVGSCSQITFKNIK